jgi:membrane-bound lytic murein transglycosylase D
MDEAHLREVNRIPRGMMIRKGSALLVPRHGRHQQDVSEQLADNGAISLQRESAGKAKAKPATPTNAKAAASKPPVSKAQAASPGQSNRKPATGGTGSGPRTQVAAGSENAVRR